MGILQHLESVMGRDLNEREHRRTHRHPEAVAMMAGADFDATPSLSAAMGLVRCIHGGRFPCAQCKANRSWNEAATGRKLTEPEFEAAYAEPTGVPLRAGEEG